MSNIFGSLRLRSTPPNEWTCRDVRRHFKRVDLGEYADALRRSKVDGRRLSQMHAEGTLCHTLGITKMGHQKRLAIAIRAIEDGRPSLKLAIPQWAKLQRSHSSPEVAGSLPEPLQRRPSTARSAGSPRLSMSRSATCATLAFSRVFGGVAFKCVYDNDVSILSLRGLHFDELREVIYKTYDRSDLHVRYVDRDGDIVAVDSDVSLRYAFEDWKAVTPASASWRLFLYDSA